MTRLDDEALVAALSDEARRVAAHDAAGEPAPGAWHRLEARRAGTEQTLGGRGARWWALRAGAGVLASAAAVALVVGVHAWRSGRPITYAVGGTAVEEGGYIRGGASAGTKVEFSEGTRIELAAGARLSVAAPGPHGARVRVEEGRAHFAVNHLPHAAWSVEAGPYVVEVTGTEFDVRWSGAEETVEVRLHKGSVRVSGPMLTEHATLRPGQHLTAHLATRELRIDEAPASLGAAEQRSPGASAPPAAVAPAGAGPPPAEVAPAEPARAPVAPSDSPPVAAAAPRETPSAPSPPARSAKASTRTVALARRSAVPDWAPATWTARVASGDAAGVVAEAVAHGIDAAVAEADGPTLAALADATRYAGRTYLAERVLLAQRTRFPGTPAAGAAAFFLGRLADDRGAVSEGLDWYGRYLTEQPNGPYAAEALGRKMLGVSRLSGRQAAHDLARDYLRRFPNGTYLLHAQAILHALPR